jgi:Tol biopolymer transport system component
MEPQTRLPPYNDEIVLVRLDGSVVYRLAHTYNNQIDFPAEVIPSISPSGTRVIFQSNWLSPTGRPTQLYVIDLRQNCSNRR